ncbi:MAG: DUF4249 domain-containing protein [Bacteroidia bacterium]
MKNSKLLFISIISLFVASSCQKVIQVDLNSADPQLVVEGYVTDAPDSIWLKLTKTVNFSDKNEFPAVDNAIVIISDSEGNSEQLSQTEPGIYRATNLQGIPGRTYNLSIEYNGEKYTASSYMNYPVEIDSLSIGRSAFSGNPTVKIHFTDPANIRNYYRYLRKINGNKTRSFEIVDDNLRNGQSTFVTLSSGVQKLLPNDTIIGYLHSIDFATFEYYRTFNQINETGPTATPGNPIGNISNGGVGFFAAYSLRSKMVIIQE